MGSAPVRPVKSASGARPTGHASTPRPAPHRPRALALPATVDVVLSTVESKRSITLHSPRRGEVTVACTPNGIIILGGDSAPVRKMRMEGPVRIGDRLHPGSVQFTAHPGGGLRAVARLPLENYVAAVVAAEIPLWSAEPAELEAQAIAARTFAIQTLRTRSVDGGPPELMDDVLDQAYHGSYEGGSSAGAQRAQSRLEAAIRATEGLCLMRGDKLEEARYHASCGGTTANFEDIFASEVASRGAAGPLGVRCPPCEQRAAAEAARRAPNEERPLGWVAELNPNGIAELGKALGLSGRVTRLFPTRRDRAGRWLEVHVEGPAAGDTRKLTFEALRKAAGYSKLKGANIATTLPRPGMPIPEGVTLKLQGRGRGHGVGLCQESLRELARAGWSSNQILRHYYPGTRVVKLPAASREDHSDRR